MPVSLFTAKLNGRPAAADAAGRGGVVTRVTARWTMELIDLSQKRHLYWSGEKRFVDLRDPTEEAWWITTVLREGRTEDVRELPLQRVRELLPQLPLPRFLKEIWETYFREVEECGA